MAVDEMYLDNLDEYVNDENRVVTYKWLSKTLSVHVNIAKQMLYSFVQKERNAKDNDNLHVMYCLSGLTKNGGNQVHKVKIVSEENLDAEKSVFSPLTSCHIYSIQKSKLQDTDILYSTDYDILKDQIFHSNKYSAIKCLLSKLRSEEEVGKLQKIAQPTSQGPSFAKSSAQNGSSTTKAPQQPKKTAGIAGMFAQGGKKTDTKHEVPATGATKSAADHGKPVEKKKAKAGGGIVSMFANQANKPKPKPKEKESVPKEEDKVIVVDSPKKTSTKKAPTKRGKTKKTQENSDDDESVQKSKKRRRIKEPAWDSSSSEDDMELDQPIPSPPREPTPPPAEPEPEEVKSEEGEDDEPIPDTPPKPGEKRRRRKRKMVSKTTVDSEGFMVTEKVWEEHSTDVSEAEEPAKPPPVKQAKTEETVKGKKKEAPAKKNSPGKSKQTSLMNFFKKK